MKGPAKGACGPGGGAVMGGGGSPAATLIAAQPAPPGVVAKLNSLIAQVGAVEETEPVAQLNPKRHK